MRVVFTLFVMFATQFCVPLYAEGRFAMRQVSQGLSTGYFGDFGSNGWYIIHESQLRQDGTGDGFFKLLSPDGSTRLLSPSLFGSGDISLSEVAVSGSGTVTAEVVKGSGPGRYSVSIMRLEAGSEGAYEVFTIDARTADQVTSATNPKGDIFVGIARRAEAKRVRNEFYTIEGRVVVSRGTYSAVSVNGWTRPRRPLFDDFGNVVFSASRVDARGATRPGYACSGSVYGGTFRCKKHLSSREPGTDRLRDGLAVRSTRGRIQIHDVRTGTLVRTVDVPGAKDRSIQLGEMLTTEVDGSQFGSVVAAGRIVPLVRMEGREITVLECAPLRGISPSRHSLMLAPLGDGRLILNVERRIDVDEQDLTVVNRGTTMFELVPIEERVELPVGSIGECDVREFSGR